MTTHKNHDTKAYRYRYTEYYLNNHLIMGWTEVDPSTQEASDTHLNAAADRLDSYRDGDVLTMCVVGSPEGTDRVEVISERSQVLAKSVERI